MRSLLLDRPGTPAAGAGGVADREGNRGQWFIRVALHVACWVPFISTAVDSWRGPWRAVGDNARMALQSWNVLSGHVPLVGQPNELPGAPHDLGPIQYWLLAIPVHLDLSRGVLWGAVLLAMLAASLTIEAAYSALGTTGALLACGFVIAILAWFPGFTTRPEDNPNFGLIWFIPTLAASLAVLSRRRKWWPVLVIAASIATQAHLTFAFASIGVVLIALVAGLIDEFRAKGGYTWLIAGVIAGAVCWVPPLVQQFTAPKGKGNMFLLLHAERAGHHVGGAFAMKALASLAVPSPLWWQQNIGTRDDLFQVLGSMPTALGVFILAITAASLVLAVWWLRSRELAGLAGISLLVSVCAATSFALIPGHVHALAGQQHDLVFIMFVAALLAWLTVISAAVLASRKLISDRPQHARQPMILRPVSVVTALLVVCGGLLATQQMVSYAGAGANSLHVGAALARIERAVPKRPRFAVSVFSPKADKFQVIMGLCYALVADGYNPDTWYPKVIRPHWKLPEEAVVIRRGTLTVVKTRVPRKTRGHWRTCNGPFPS